VTKSASRKYSLRTVFSSHHSDGGSGCPLSCSNESSGLKGASFCNRGSSSTASGNRNSKGYSIRPTGQFALGVGRGTKVFSCRKTSVVATLELPGLLSFVARHVVRPMNLIETRCAFVFTWTSTTPRTGSLLVWSIRWLERVRAMDIRPPGVFSWSG
jgi:hypothetical protein